MGNSLSILSNPYKMVSDGTGQGSHTARETPALVNGR